MKPSPRLVPYLQVAPLTVILVAFLIAPLTLIVAVSFFDFDLIVGIIPTITLANYVELFTSRVTLSLYLGTIKFAVIVWAVTLVVGFAIAYFLVFHVRSLTIAIGLFLLCTIPFWTSNIIRMISWIPLLGKQGAFNHALLATGVVDEPVLWLLFSDFSVVVGYVNLFTLFMIVPIFNSMARIDKSLLEAAVDGGASRWGVMWEVVIPLSRTGMALGSIFVVTLVMGDFFVVKVLSGGRSASVVSAMFEDVSLLIYPPAGAASVVLLIIVILMVTAILRIVNVRKEITG